MHDSDNKDGLFSNLIKNPVRESIDDASPAPMRKDRPRLRKIRDSRQARLDFGGKFNPQTQALPVVVIDRLREFGFRAGEDLDLHRLPILCNTAAAESVCIFPAS